MQPTPLTEAEGAPAPALLTRDQILAADDIPYDYVHVPEWKTGDVDTVRIKGLNGRQRDAFEAALLGERKGKGKNATQQMNMENLRSKLCSQAIVDGTGKTIFNQTDVRLLGEKSAAALDRVFAAARKLSGLTDEDVEDLTEDLSDGPSGSSSSDSVSS